MTSAVFFVPQFEEGNSHYFASGGRYLSTTPEPVPDFDLWAQVNALDTVTAPATVVATRSRGSTALLYRVEFPAGRRVSTLFEVSDQVFFIPPDRFLQLQSAKPCVQVPGNDWASCEFRFHVLAAFYRLSVVPSLSLSLFARDDLFESMCDRFFELYRVSPPLERALAEVFADVVFALDFFGFAFPTNLTEKNSIGAAQAIVADFEAESQKNRELQPQRRFFAFTEIKFAIENYHKSCFPNREADADVLDFQSYGHLLNAVEFVRRALAKLNMIPEELPPKKALSEAVVNFRRANQLPSGACDLFTFRHIWNASLADECDLMALCRINGLDVSDPRPPVYTRTIPKIEVTNDRTLEPVQKVVNQIIAEIKDRSEAPQWMLGEAQKSVEAQIHRIEQASRVAKVIEEKVRNIEATMNETCEKNDRATKKFDEATTVLEEVLQEHDSMKREFEVIKQRLEEERMGNQILLAIVIALMAVVVVRFLSK